jgi:hypothetical protein
VSLAKDQQFEERAAIMEYEGGLNRREAEWHASFLTYGQEIVLQELYEERAAIMHYDGRLSLNEAERRARSLIYGEANHGRRAEELQGFRGPHVRLPQQVY